MRALIFFLLAILIIIIASAKFKVHPFLTLLFAAIFMGFAAGLGGGQVLKALAEGFGGTLGSIGIIIACGTIIGVFVERSGGAGRMAEAMLGLVGEKRAPLAMSCAPPNSTPSWARCSGNCPSVFSFRFSSPRAP